jgi:hypothetical protein
MTLLGRICDAFPSQSFQGWWEERRPRQSGKRAADSYVYRPDCTTPFRSLPEVERYLQRIGATTGDALGQACDALGQARDALGQACDAAGQACDAPGQACDALGQACDALGQACDALGQACDAAGKRRRVRDPAARILDIGHWFIKALLMHARCKFPAGDCFEDWTAPKRTPLLNLGPLLRVHPDVLEVAVEEGFVYLRCSDESSVNARFKKVAKVLATPCWMPSVEATSGLKVIHIKCTQEVVPGHVWSFPDTVVDLRVDCQSSNLTPLRDMVSWPKDLKILHLGRTGIVNLQQAPATLEYFCVETDRRMSEQFLVGFLSGVTGLLGLKVVRNRGDCPTLPILQDIFASHTHLEECTIDIKETLLSEKLLSHSPSSLCFPASLCRLTVRMPGDLPARLQLPDGLQQLQFDYSGPSVTLPRSLTSLKVTGINRWQHQPEWSPRFLTSLTLQACVGIDLIASSGMFPQSLRYLCLSTVSMKWSSRGARRTCLPESLRHMKVVNPVGPSKWMKLFRLPAELRVLELEEVHRMYIMGVCPVTLERLELRSCTNIKLWWEQPVIEMTECYKIDVPFLPKVA